MQNNKVYDFVGKRKIFFIISACIILVSLLCSLIFGVEVSIEFKGGTIITYSYENELNTDDVKKTVEAQIGQTVNVTESTDISTGAKNIQVSLHSEQGLTADKQFELTTKLEEVYADNSIKLVSSNDVSPSSGREFFLKCMVAVLFAFIILIIYIAIRFKRISGWSAGVMAIVALIHDVLVVYATFVIFRIPIDANFMAVTLTILGYSVNDTIVIYDRIRENKKLLPKSTTTADLVNISVSQSLSRSINTSITTIMCMIVVSIVAVAMGVTSILSFSFPLIIGMISGTYSSLGLVGSLWVMWQEHKAKTASYAKK